MIPRIHMGKRQEAGSGGSFEPTDVSSVQAWYDSTTTDNFTFSSGTDISQWDDLSGNSNHASITGTVTYESGTTLNGYGSVTGYSESGGNYITIPSITFSGASAPYDGYFITVCNLSSTTSAYSVCSEVGSNSYHPISVSSTNTNNERSQGSNYYGDAGADFSVDGTTFTNTDRGSSYTPLNTTNWKIICMPVRLKNSSTSLLPFTNPSSYSYQYLGYTTEIIVCDSYISASDRQKIEGYLAHKYALTGNLPAGHPYKSSAP